MPIDGYTMGDGINWRMKFDPRKAERQMPNGIYELHWIDGGTSVAAVGILYDGKRWYAPCNWTTGARIADSRRAPTGAGSCGLHTGDITIRRVDRPAAPLAGGAVLDPTVRAFVEAQASPAPEPALANKLYDGITAEECLVRFTRQQQDHFEDRHDGRLTPLQLECARSMWSAQLRRSITAGRPDPTAVTYSELDADD